MTIENIRNKGAIVARDNSRSYYLYNDCLYSIEADHFSIWCSVSDLSKHLHRLYQVTGRKFFSDTADMVIIDSDFFAGYYFA